MDLLSCERIKRRVIMVIHPFRYVRVSYIRFAHEECSVSVCRKSSYGENGLIRPINKEMTQNCFLKSKYFRHRACGTILQCKDMLFML